MLAYIVGNLFESPAQVLVNTVNTVGVMGKGIAKDFKRIYPEMFKQYQQHCERKKLTVGKLWLYKTSNKWILNFPTKTTWKKPSNLKYIEDGLQTFVKSYAERGITSVAFPKLGCGNGELDWNDVRPLMEQYLKQLPIDVFIYIPDKNNPNPEHTDIKNIKKWLRSDPESLGFSEIWDDLRKEISEGMEIQKPQEYGCFKLSILPGERPGIAVNTQKEGLFQILEDELVDFWRFVRRFGFVNSAIIPPPVSDYYDILVPLFARLPYCKEILFSKNFDRLHSNDSKGIQFIPPHSPRSDLPLFKCAPKPESA